MSCFLPPRPLLCTAVLMISSSLASTAHAGFHLAALEQDPPGFEDSGLSEDPMLYGALGFDVIDGDTWVTVALRPELSFGRLGVGLHLPLRFSTASGELRSEDWDTASDYFSFFRYVRWAHKGDPLYVRVGIQDNATIGHGSIMRHYANTLDDDDRKTGFVLDMNRGAWGFESIYSNFARAEILGGRAYYRPFFQGTRWPLLKTLGIGATLVTDMDPNPYGPGDAAVVMGFDIDMPIIRRSTFDLTLYYDHARIKDYGSGNIVGAVDVLRFPANSMTLTTRLERRFLGDEFVVPYFNHFYELNRARQLESLAGLKSESGWFGEALLNILNTLYVEGSYAWKDGDPDGILHAETRLPSLMPNVRLRAAYDRYHVDGFDDVFALDDDSHLYLEAKYRLNTFLWLVGSFHRTWRLAPDSSWDPPGVPDFESTDRTAVRIEFAIPIPIG